MKKACENHPEVKAESFCRNCGGAFCSDCLVEGGNYYFCKKPGCLTAQKNDLPKFSESSSSKTFIKTATIKVVVYLCILLSNLYCAFSSGFRISKGHGGGFPFSPEEEAVILVVVIVLPFFMTFNFATSRKYIAPKDDAERIILQMSRIGIFVTALGFVFTVSSCCGVFK